MLTLLLALGGSAAAAALLVWQAHRKNHAAEAQDPDPLGLGEPMAGDLERLRLRYHRGQKLTREERAQLVRALAARWKERLGRGDAHL